LQNAPIQYGAPITCNVCVAASEYCRIGTGVVTGCFISSSSVFVVDDCCLSRFGDDGLTTGGGRGGGGGTVAGISIGIEGKSERAGDILVRFVICKINDQN
jgi:hypothetical protein